jgi:hypothetical protein
MEFWPDSPDYTETIQNPHLCFRDPELRQGEVAINTRGTPLLWTGNFAAVYRVHCPATNLTWAVKCFTRKVEGLQQRYEAISAHLQRVQRKFLVECEYLEKGIQVKRQWYPVLKMLWVEGLGLNEFVKDQLGKPAILDTLAQLWVRLAQELRQCEMAHADLQHGNVLLIPGPKNNSVKLRLVDYDGMYVPALRQSAPGERGHPNFQHPQRLREGTYNAEIDRFSHLVIYTALRCLFADSETLWQRYDNQENLLFRERDFRDPASSALFQDLWQRNDVRTRGLVGHLLLASQGPIEQVPLLEELVGDGRRLPCLTADQENQVQALLKAGASRVHSIPRFVTAATNIPAIPFPLESPATTAPRKTPLPGPTPSTRHVPPPMPRKPSQPIPAGPSSAVRGLASRPQRARWAGSNLPSIGLVLCVAGGIIIAACLFVVALWQLLRPAPNLNNVGPPNADQVASTDSGQKDKDAEKKAIADAAKDTAAKKDKDEEPDTVVKKDKEVKPDTVANKDKGGNSAIQVIDVKPAPVEQIAFNPPNLKPAVLGQYEPNLKVPQVLLQRGSGDKAGWERIWGKNLDIASARPLLSLPAMKNEVELNNGVHLTLWGTAPEIWPNYLVYESMVELYVNDALAVDMTLLRGRIVLANTRSPSKPVVVRVRFEDPTQQKQAYFDITLRDNATAVAIERLCGFPQNEPFFEDAKHANRQGPYAEVLCFFLAGGGNVRSSNVAFAVDAAARPQWIRWNSSKGLESPQPFSMPDWILPTPKLGDSKDRARTLEAAAMLAHNLKGKKQGKKLDVALQEAMDIEAEPAARLEALRCYVAMDDFSILLEMLDQDNPRERLRRSAVESLRYWMAQERDNEYKLFEKLKASSGTVVARKVMELLHGISAADARQPATWQLLIENLDNREVSLRELSAWNLELLVPAARKIDYPPSAPFGIAAAPQDERRNAQAAWRLLIPPGSLPKTPKKK